MRDLLFKNLTSTRKKRRIIISSEVIDKEGVRSIIRRHFVCLLKEVKDNKFPAPEPYIYILKERNTREQKEKFFCRIKGSLYAVNNHKIFLITFTHSLKITLSALPCIAQ
ncbi:MAG: hypothetical protein WC321_02035 [Candidatus Omnitrophota bacterium]|jgi:hypothetical protein